MTTYVDGFVIPLPRDQVDAYRKLATTAAEVWRDHGALEYVECIAEDVEPGKLTSFPRSVLLEENETVVFAWIVYASRAERDRINEAVMKDPRIAGMSHDDVPFDGKRMIYGGFDVLLRAGDSDSNTTK